MAEVSGSPSSQSVVGRRSVLRLGASGGGSTGCLSSPSSLSSLSSLPSLACTFCSSIVVSCAFSEAVFCSGARSIVVGVRRRRRRWDIALNIPPFPAKVKGRVKGESPRSPPSRNDRRNPQVRVTAGARLFGDSALGLQCWKFPSENDHDGWALF